MTDLLQSKIEDKLGNVLIKEVNASVKTTAPAGNDLSWQLSR